MDGSPTIMMLTVPLLSTRGRLRRVAVSLPRIDALLEDDETRYRVPFEPKAFRVSKLRSVEWGRT